MKWLQLTLNSILVMFLCRHVTTNAEAGPPINDKTLLKQLSTVAWSDQNGWILLFYLIYFIFPS